MFGDKEVVSAKAACYTVSTLLLRTFSSYIMLHTHRLAYSNDVPLATLKTVDEAACRRRLWKGCFAITPKYYELT